MDLKKTRVNWLMLKTVFCGNCGKEFDSRSANSVLTRFGRKIFFCSETCANEFLKGKKR